MWLQSLSITNHKPFFETQTARFAPTINVVIGQNNAGKSSLLEPLNLAAFEPKAHASPLAPERRTAAPPPGAMLRAILSGQEIRSFLRRTGMVASIPGQFENDQVQAIDDLFGLTSVIFDFQPVDRSLNVIRESSWNLDPYPPARRKGPGYTGVSLDDKTDRLNFYGGGPGSNVLSEQIARLFQQNLYFFQSERLSIGRCARHENPRLFPDGTNLPELLNKLQESPDDMGEYISNVRQIIPNVKSVASIFDGKEYVIKISPSYSRPRAAYTQDLEECGTGLSQVLALVYAFMKADGGVIVVDEPNSFLHPGASKALIETMRRYPSNQYILSTHSPEVLSAAKPEQIVGVRRREYDTEIIHIRAGDLEDIRDVLSDLGASLSDVFGLEKVVWVEGETEREIFPLVIESFQLQMPAGLVFVPMRTSEVAGKGAKARVVADLHQRISAASAVVPTSLAFSFDSDVIGPREQEDLRRTLEGRAFFLPKPMIESYVLNAAAIAATIRAESENTINSSEAAIEEWCNGQKVDLSSAAAQADAANLLKRIFWDVATMQFRKTHHSKMIIEHILLNAPDSLNELRDYVRQLINT